MTWLEGDSDSDVRLGGGRVRNTPGKNLPFFKLQGLESLQTVLVSLLCLNIIKFLQQMFLSPFNDERFSLK